MKVILLILALLIVVVILQFVIFPKLGLKG